MKHNQRNDRTQKQQQLLRIRPAPNWPEANQVAIYMCGRELEQRVYQEQNSTSGQNESWTQEIQILRQAS